MLIREFVFINILMLNKQFGRRVMTHKAPPPNIIHWEGNSVRGEGNIGGGWVVRAVVEFTSPSLYLKLQI